MDVIGVSSQRRRQLIDITSFVQEAVAASDVAEGVCHVFVPHTTAALTLNENADPTVPQDLLEAFEKVLPGSSGATPRATPTPTSCPPSSASVSTSRSARAS